LKKHLDHNKKDGGGKTLRSWQKYLYY